MIDQLHKEAEEKNVSFVNLIINRIQSLEERDGIPRTIFAACPNSMESIRSALKAAKRWDAPIKFPATLNQVDTDGGYTGLTQEELVNLIKQEAREINYRGAVIIAIDHGGPWLKDIHKRERWPLKETMDAVKNSYEKAIDAGYDLIHVDPTMDITLADGQIIDIDVVVERTIELMEHAEQYRESRNLPRIAYEVGTEEVHGGLADVETFKCFLEQLKSGLEKKGIDAWPVFVVGKVGTDLHTSTFDPEMTGKLTEIAAPYGCVIKGHYTDNVENPQDYPTSGMGGANVGPEFTEREYDGIMELVGLEENLHQKGWVAKLSKIKETLWQSVISSNRWKKWVKEGESDQDFYANSKERQEWFVKTGGRYIWERPQVVAARTRLYENLSKNGINSRQVVEAHIENSMDKYFHNFNLSGLNKLLLGRK